MANESERKLRGKCLPTTSPHVESPFSQTKGISSTQTSEDKTNKVSLFQKIGLEK
jgi:hypothetical protein